jgi:hypothetical protein
MKKQWMEISKVEFLILTSNLKGRRALSLGLLYITGFIWAVIGAPLVFQWIFEIFIPLAYARALLIPSLPGLMRSLILFIWMILLIYPMSQALAEIRISQWEILLSHDVKTRSILAGTYLGKIPLYGLFVLYLTPVVFTPVALIFQISLIGQALIYITFTLMALSTVWISNFLIALIQSKLGESPRGNDLAKALAVLVVIFAIIPMCSLFVGVAAMSELLGLNIFLMLPFTWSADMITWFALLFNGIGLTNTQIMSYTTILQLDLLTSTLLMGGFAAGFGVLGVLFADRVFTITAGARTEVITTVKRENVILRGFRKLSPGSSGALVVFGLKDFFRKAQNLAKVVYSIVLALVLPYFLLQIGYEPTSTYGSIMTNLFFVMVGVFPFAGTGFLESRDQLWLIQSASSGVSRFIRSRLLAAVLIAIPLSAVPTMGMYFLFALDFTVLPKLLLTGYLVVLGAAMVTIGVTAQNPNYEGMKSPVIATIMITSMLLSTLPMVLGPVILDMVLGMVFHIDLFVLFEPLLGPIGANILGTFHGMIILFAIGIGMVVMGTRSLTQPDS